MEHGDVSPERRSPFPARQKAALGPIPPAAAAAAGAEHTPSSLTRIEVPSPGVPSPGGRLLPSSDPANPFPTMLLLPRAKTPGQLGELKGLLRAPTPYHGSCCYTPEYIYLKLACFHCSHAQQQRHQYHTSTNLTLAPTTTPASTATTFLSMVVRLPFFSPRPKPKQQQQQQ